MPIQRAYAHPTTVSVDPSTVVDTGLTPESPGEPYHTTLKVDGDGYMNWTGNRGLRPTADGTFTDWTTACTIRPDGDGTYEDWNGTYQDWDDVTPDGGLSCVRAIAHNWKESSSLTSPVSATGSISKVRVTIVARTSVTPSENLTEMLVIGGTMYEGVSHNLTTAFSGYSSEWASNPDTTSAWSWSDIETLEAGVRSIQNGTVWTGELRVTQLCVDVLTTTSGQDYTFWDDWPTHNNDGDYLYVSGDAKHETSQLEDHTADDTFDIGKVRVVAYARANETTDENLVLTLGVIPPGLFDSRPTSHTDSGLTYTDSSHDADEAYDNDMGTYAEFNYELPATGSHLTVQDFTTTTGAISEVDFKMKYAAVGQSKGGMYEIKYSIDGTTWVTLVGPTGDAHSVPGAGYDEWASEPRPGGGSWTWTDINSILFRVETTIKTKKTVPAGVFSEYEAWVTVHYTPSPIAYEGESHSLTTTYQRYAGEWPWNPANGSQWKWSHIDALEAGVTSKEVGGSWTGEIRVSQLYLEVVGGTSLRPDGNGAFTDWTNDYHAWDEPSFHNDDTDYVYATAGGWKESSTMQDHTRSETWQINLVRVVIYARTSVATDEKMALMVYEPLLGANTEVVQTPSFSLTTTYEKYTWTLNINPVYEKHPIYGFPMPGPWNWTAVDSLQFGVVSEATGPFTGQIRVTQLYIEVIGGNGNYKAWDESPTHNGDSDYLSAEYQGLIQTSTIEDSALSWGIASVKVTFVARITVVDDEPEKIAPVLVTGGNVYKGAFIPLTTNYETYTAEWGLDPDTGNLWDWTAINALEVGVASWVSGDLKWAPDGEVRITQIYVEVSGPGFAVDIKVDTVTDLWQYAFEMFYNPDLIRGVWAEGDCPHRVGPFLTSAGGTASENPGGGFNQTVGWLEITGCYLEEMTAAKCPDGGGVLATVVFEVLRQGETVLRLGEKTVLFDYTGSKIIEGRAYVSDGYFRNIDSGLIPTADFDWAADSPVPNPNEPLEGYNVTFTNTSIPASGKKIDVCRWYFWRRGKALRELHIPVITSESSVTRNFTTRATYNVTLTVFDSDGVVGSTSDWLTVKAHDVFFNAVYTNSSRCWLPAYPEGKIEIDRILEINAEAINEGDFTETFDVTLFWTAFYEGESHNGTIGTKQTVTDLSSGVMQNVTFLWDTTGFSLTHPDRYVLHANASRVDYEYDTERTPTSLADNEYSQGAPRFRFHDMAVTENPPAYPPPLVPSEQTIQPGDPVEVTVTVTNEGDFNETSLTIKTWAEKQGAAPININTTTFSLMTNLTFSETYMAHIPPYEDNYTATYSFTWDTTAFAGNYTIWSEVTIVANDYETGDNTYTAGWIKVQPAVPEFPLGVALEIAVAVVIVYVWWKGRRKAKPPNPQNPRNF